TGPRVFLDRGGRAVVNSSTAVIGLVQIGGTNSRPPEAGPPAVLPVNGDLAQFSNGTLQLDIGSSSQFGRLQVAGLAQLGGTLQVSLLNSFVPSVGQTFQF